MRPHSLDAACHRHVLKGVYTVSALQNPTGAMMSAQRRADIAAKVEEIARRADLLKAKLNGFRFRYEQNSIFAWLKLPDDWSGSDFEKTAYENGVNVIPSDRFVIGGIAPPPYVRISLSGADSAEEFESGLDVLSKMLRFEISPNLCV